MTKTAIQLYTLRDIPAPLPEVIARVGEAGFEGVEFATRLGESSPDAVGDALDSSGVLPVAAHVDLTQLNERRSELMSTGERLGFRRFVVPHISIDRFRTRTRLEALCQELTLLAEALDDRGFVLVIHTTREQLLPFFARSWCSPPFALDGLPTGGYAHLGWLVSQGVRRSESHLVEATPLGRIAALTSDAPIEFEVDAKSVATSGFDMETVLAALGDRTRLVHLSDVIRTRQFPPDYAPVEPGHGVVDPDEVIRAVADHDIDWLIFEHDDPPDPEATLCATGAMARSRVKPPDGESSVSAAEARTRRHATSD